MFVSQSSPNGAMQVNGIDADWQKKPIGWVSSADDICQHDAELASWIGDNATIVLQIKNTTGWKAMIVDGTSRTNVHNWVLSSNTEYYDIISNEKIGITNSDAVFDFNLDNV